MTYYDRYKNGECREVCSELLAMGTAVRDSAVVEDAAAVAREFVSRAVRNVKQIHSRLLGLGYAFRRPKKALVVREEPCYREVNAFEREMGTLPLVVREWYARVESLDFGQSEDQFRQSDSDLKGLEWHYELLVWSLDEAMLAWAELKEQHQELREHYRREKMNLYQEDPVPCLITGGCASNNDSDGFSLPCLEFDAVKREDGESLTYTDFFRKAFQYGGFPVLTCHDQYLKQHTSLYPRPNIERLLPLLTQDIIAL
ncbi:hypothetical protein [Prosthecobacter sp.]|uniref:hypothetical protein n=1 Tax=Prosthecobacter sp. TaxID=1965333 RepID=UPI0037851B0E